MSETEALQAFTCYKIDTLKGMLFIVNLINVQKFFFNIIYQIEIFYYIFDVYFITIINKKKIIVEQKHANEVY